MIKVDLSAHTFDPDLNDQAYLYRKLRLFREHNNKVVSEDFRRRLRERKKKEE